MSLSSSFAKITLVGTLFVSVLVGTCSSAREVLSDVRYLPAVCFLKDSTSLSNLVLIGGAGAAADPDFPEERKVGEGVGWVEPAPLPSRNTGAAV
jgi:hypothetical protein